MMNSDLSSDKNRASGICDPNTGLCGTNEPDSRSAVLMQPQTKARVIYYTDPICSHCWGIEPILKKLAFEYGDHFEIEYRMGGLLETWDGFRDPANGIFGPAQVAPHWDEVGIMSGMSIDGDIWLEDPLPSSYPPSIAFKAVQKQDKDKALRFLRRIREMVFLEKQNICKEELLVQAAAECAVDVKRFQRDFNSDAVRDSFFQERDAGRQMGIHGFPSIIFVNDGNEGLVVSGRRDYQTYVDALAQSLGSKPQKNSSQQDELSLLNEYGCLATVEIAMVLDKQKETVERVLQQKVLKGVVEKIPQKFGDFWRLADS